MRNDSASHRPLHLAPNLTPLVDVVIVVLIFMMLAGSFGGATHFLQSSFSPPARDSKIRSAGGRLPTQALTLDLFIADGSDGVGFTVQGVGVDRTSDIRLLTDCLRSKADGFSAGGMAPGDVEVVLHPHRNVRFGHLTAVYEAAARARFSRIAFASAD